MGNTLFDKIWDRHVVKTIAGGPSVLYIDKHFIHEVTSPQAFKGLQQRGLKVFRPAQVVATADHNVPTLNQHLPIKEELSRIQVEQLKKNCAEFGIELYGLGHPYQGIVHVIGPDHGVQEPPVLGHQQMPGFAPLRRRRFIGLAFHPGVARHLVLAAAGVLHLEHAFGNGLVQHGRPHSDSMVIPL